MYNFLSLFIGVSVSQQHDTDKKELCIHEISKCMCHFFVSWRRACYIWLYRITIFIYYIFKMIHENYWAFSFHWKILRTRLTNHFHNILKCTDKCWQKFNEYFCSKKKDSPPFDWICRCCSVLMLCSIFTRLYSTIHTSKTMTCSRMEIFALVMWFWAVACLLCMAISIICTLCMHKSKGKGGMVRDEEKKKKKRACKRPLNF